MDNRHADDDRTRLNGIDDYLIRRNIGIGRNLVNYIQFKFRSVICYCGIISIKRQTKRRGFYITIGNNICFYNGNNGFLYIGLHPSYIMFIVCIQ